MGASIINKANKIQEANAINSANINTNQFNLSDKYIRLYENKDDSFTSKIFNLVKIQSTSYTIHGGKSYGDNKGIDLATQDLAFFKVLQNLTNKYKVELENANNEIRVEVRYESGWHDPVDNPQITIYTSSGKFNPKIATFGTFKDRHSGIHQGVDLFAPIGTPIYACLSGEVCYSAYGAQAGHAIIIKITDKNQLEVFKNRKNTQRFIYQGEMTADTDMKYKFDENSKAIYLRYLHLSERLVKQGTKAKAGDKIGLSGVSGNIAQNTLAPHLHFEILSYFDGSYRGGFKYRINPSLYVYYKVDFQLTQKEKDYQLTIKNAREKEIKKQSIQKG